MYDVTIIGSGPAGLGAALYLQRAGFRVLIIEKEYEGAGQIEKGARIENYLGIPAISGYELGEKFRNHVLSYGAPFLEAEAVALRHKQHWEVLLADGKTIESEALIYAAGAVPRRLGVKGEAEYLGRGVSYCAFCDGSLYRQKTVAVVGGGDAALDDALYLSNICGKVFLVHRRKQFRGAYTTLKKIIKRENIEILTEIQITEICGRKKVEQVELNNGNRLKIDGLFIAIGSIPETEAARGFVQLDESGYIRAAENGVTQSEGLFAAGDVRTKKLRQVITAVADGANAATSATEWLRHKLEQEGK